MATGGSTSVKQGANAKFSGGGPDNRVDVGKTFLPSYPPTIDFASSPEETHRRIHEGKRSRRPGGSMRGSGPWHTNCHEASHKPEHIKGEDGDNDKE